MRYGEFRAKGWCVSSAVVEAGCKNVIDARLKKAECTGVSEARTKLAVRSCVKSHLFDDYWYQRIVGI